MPKTQKKKKKKSAADYQEAFSEAVSDFFRSKHISFNVTNTGKCSKPFRVDSVRWKSKPLLVNVDFTTRQIVITERYAAGKVESRSRLLDYAADFGDDNFEWVSQLLTIKLDRAEGFAPRPSAAREAGRITVVVPTTDEVWEAVQKSPPLADVFLTRTGEQITAGFAGLFRGIVGIDADLKVYTRDASGFVFSYPAKTVAAVVDKFFDRVVHWGLRLAYSWGGQRGSTGDSWGGQRGSTGGWKPPALPRGYHDVTETPSKRYKEPRYGSWNDPEPVKMVVDDED